AVETGGALAFSYLNTRVTGPRLRVEGTLELAADSVIAMQKMPSAKIWLATATGDLIDSGAAITAEIGSGPVRLLVEGRDLYALNLDWAANPGKDVAAAFDALTALSAAVRARVGEGFLLPLVDRGAGGGKNSLWVKTVGSRARRDGDAEKTGHEDETLGLIVGCDKMLGANLLVGGHAGYTCSEITTGNRAETTANQPFAGLYASYKAGRFYATADATAGTLDADTLRHEGGNRVTGSYQALALGAGAEIGAVLPLGKAATLRPAAALHGMRYRFGHHMEFAPAGEGALMLDDFTVNHVESLAGVRFARAFRTPWALPGMVEVSAGWRRTLHDDDAPLGVTFASNETERAVIERAVYRRDRANLGAALRFALRADMLASLAYDYEFASGSTRDTLAASFAWSW
ncbi:MAG: autotransporter outer membrane beta-barrel domain-containing protein, partial [Opitutaceae bacterium]|nr:autotransporter outer membrane beta-barrel domain-containing protein [Opitutaceae bacterium]